MISLLRSFVSRFLQSRGYRVVKESRWLALRQQVEESKTGTQLSRRMKEIISRYEIDCVFDVGANEGTFAESLRRDIGYAGWIISFEPLPDVAQKMQKLAAADPKWEVHTMALGAEPGSLPFHRMSSDVFSSFLAPDSSQPGKYSDCNQVVSTEMVPVSTVELIWADVKKRLGVKRMLLKMDTQGYDLQVFAGAQKILSDIPALLSEMSCIRIYSGAPTFEEGLNVYKQAGYAPASLAPLSFDDSCAAIEFDILMVRPQALAQKP